MIHVFNIIAIVGFALSAVLLIAAAVIYQTKKIRQVRDDLTGKTAARSIAEIRLRAKKHKHTTTQAAKRYGWEKDEIPSGALSSFARIGGTAAGPASARTGGGAGRGDEHVQTSVLAKGSGDEYVQTTELASGSDDDEYSQTTVLADAASGDELNQTTVLVGEQGEEGTQTTVLAPDGGEVLQPSLKKKAAHLPPQTGALVVLLLAACVFAATSFAWGEEGAAAAGQAQEEGSPDGGEGALGAGSAADGQPTAGSADASQPQTGDQENAPGTGEANGQNAPMGVQGLSSPVAPMAATTFYFPNAVSLRRGPTTLAPPVTIVNGEPCMWLGAADLSSTVTLRSTPNGALSFYPTSDPNFDPNTINWAIVPSIPSIASTDTFPIYIYVMANTTLSLTLGETQLTDPNATTGAVIPAGTVFILPILCYDKESPAITSIAMTPADGFDIDDATSGLITTSLTFTITAPDFDIAAGGTADDYRDSGIASVTLDCGVGVQLQAVPDPANPGQFIATLSTDGTYAFSDITITATDQVGNTSSVNLQDYLDNLAPESRPEYSSITIDNSTPDISPIVVTPDDGDSTNDPYYTSPCSVTIDITDRFFSRPSRKKLQTTVVATISYLDGNGDTQSLDIKLQDFANTGTGAGITWEYTTPLSFDTEACYTVSVNYIAANRSGSITAQRTFYIDCTPPTVDAARLYTTQASQLYHGIICEPSQAALELDLSDAVSGIDPAALTLTLGGVAYTLAGDPGMMSFTQDAAGTGNLKGTLRLELPADDSLALFAGVALAYADMSRNAGQASLSDLPIGYFDLDTQDPQATDYSKAEGIVVDSADPVLSVSYDNNDVRNGRYYNAPRTMAIELVEGTFYLVQAYQGTTVVATVSVGGADRKVTAKDFTNPSGDGVTWVYRFPCDLDGEYGVAASFTDPSGKGAAPFADGFIIDKTDPLIMVAFDNNSAQNGKYYKAPRTATVTVYEQNFSPALASIATSAGNGNAPGASGWTQAKAGVWQATVYFGQETSYALQVGCTDLAGNSAKQVSVPEFVIDMTAPLVSIERVDNLAAYAGEVEPLVKFSDLNFMAYLTDITITGALQGQVYSLASTEALTDTSRTVDYADFDYRLERDDVYTIDATIHDLAGNEAQATVTFSVNRFGSNYLYAPATEPLIGSYLKSAQQVVVSEVNVSGLSSSEVKLARNDSVRTLSEGTDYTVEQSGGQGEWSYYTYTFPKALFEDDGYYRILLSSHDAAGNFSDNLMDGKNADRTGAFVVSFAVDNTAPIATFANLMSNTTAFAPSRTVEIYANDNLAAAKATLIVNNQVVRTWDEEELADALVLSYDLPASEGLYTVRFEVRDKAGNTTTVSADNILVTNNLFLYIISTPGVLYPLIAGLILVIGTGAVIVNRVLARKRKKVTKRVEWQAFADGGGQASPRTR